MFVNLYRKKKMKKAFTQYKSLANKRKLGRFSF